LEFTRECERSPLNRLGEDSINGHGKAAQGRVLPDQTNGGVGWRILYKFSH